MIVDFVGFMSLAAVCFSGFLFTLYTLGKQTWKLKEIAWLLLYVLNMGYCPPPSDLSFLLLRLGKSGVSDSWLFLPP